MCARVRDGEMLEERHGKSLPLLSDPPSLVLLTLCSRGLCLLLPRVAMTTRRLLLQLTHLSSTKDLLVSLLAANVEETRLWTAEPGLLTSREEEHRLCLIKATC